MKGLVAEAYQLKLGKNESNMLRGDKAITALTDAMKKSQVKTAEIIPYLDALMRRDATPGLSIARNSAQAEQNRFENQISTGWDRFTKGGGEAGLRAFWQMAQQMSNWWEENGSALGRYFHATVIGLDAMRLAIMELWKFMATGESTPITEWMKGIGIDVDSIRQNFINLKNATMELLGIDPKKSVADNLKGISDKLVVFVNDLDGILKSVVTIVEGLTKVRKYFFPTQAEKEAGATAEQKAYAADLATVGEHDAERRKFFRQWENSPGKGMLDAGGALWGGTWQAVGGMGGLAFGNNTPYNLTATEYERNIAQIPTSFPQTSPQAIAAERTRELIIWQKSQVEVNVNISGSEQAINALSNATNFTKADFNSLLSKNIASQMVNAPK